ncbi:MAG: TIGR02302 family protein [Alphaproteobacteria bacterium]|nr:TIGR02302 family protein [Alphaproteobacteria bacterium]
MRAPIARARLALWWEQAWPALWPTMALLGLFVALALLDVWRWVPGWLHLAALLATAATLAAALIHAAQRTRWPVMAAAVRRIEAASGLRHRPIASAADQLAGSPGDAMTAALWTEHQRRLRTGTRHLRVGVPRAGLAQRDQRGFRAAVGLLLVIGIAVGGEDAEVRLGRALMPTLGGPTALPGQLEAWVSPPAYTALPPRYLDPAVAEAAGVPQGSKLVASVHGGRGLPSLLQAGAATRFAAVDSMNFELRLALDHGGEIRIEQDGRTLGQWRLTVVPDQPPAVGFASEPAASARGALRVSHTATDDYRVASVRLVVRRAADPDETFAIALAGAGADPRRSVGVTYRDLTAHPWAGLPVVLHLQAEDGIAQTGLSAPFAMTLPERAFTNPVARAIAEQRKRLAQDETARESVADALEALSRLSESYHDDLAAFLGLQSAAKRLRYDRSPEALREAQETLWQTARRAEDGAAAQAEAELRRAQEALREALARGAPDAEIEALMRQLEAALDRFLQALAEQAARQAERGSALPEIGPDANTLSRQDLQRMLEDVRRLNQSGSRERAQDLLAELQDMLENLRAGTRPSPSDEAAQRALGELGALTRRQQQLLDQTFRDAQSGATDGAQALACQQEALRRQLGEIMAMLGELGGIPDGLGQAEQAMRRARDALGEGDSGLAIDPQTRAIEELRRGAQAALAQMIERLSDEPGQGAARRRGRGQDPFGRGVEDDGGLGVDGEVEIPEEGDVQRARRIIDELYRRAGDPSRPVVERNYITRLLRRF